jgi:calnexin
MDQILIAICNAGVWKHAKSDGHEDYGLLVSEPAKKYAIVKELDTPVTLKDGTVVLQFEVRLQNGLECGGAYLKYIRVQDTGLDTKEFDNGTPYTIMFGPDKCGSTNKVHFILKHKNPKTGEYVEHHLKSPPSVPYDKLSHVYTAILKPDNELRILIDGEEKSKANFLSSDDFEPALIPSKTIPDPDDKKPEDWDERAKIPDPDATKPMTGMRMPQWRLWTRRPPSQKDGWMMSLMKLTTLRLLSLKTGMMRRTVRHRRLTAPSAKRHLDVVNGRSQ